MSTRFLDLETIIAIHDGEDEGGIRELERLEEAVARPMQTFQGQDLHVDVWHKAAALIAGISGKQGFWNGNKRTAWLSALTFLELNGWGIDRVSDVDGTVVGLAASISDIDLDELAEWFQTHSFPLYEPQENVPDGIFQTPFGWTSGVPHTAPAVEVEGIMTFFVQDGARVRLLGWRSAVNPLNVSAQVPDQQLEYTPGLEMNGPMWIKGVIEMFKDMGFRIKDPQPVPQFAPPPEPAREGPSRNAPCPCGSGKKFKLCHGRGVRN